MSDLPERIERLAAANRDLAKELRKCEGRLARTRAQLATAEEELARLSDGRRIVRQDPERVSLGRQLLRAEERISELEEEVTRLRRQEGDPRREGQIIDQFHRPVSTSVSEPRPKPRPKNKARKPARLCHPLVGKRQTLGHRVARYLARSGPCSAQNMADRMNAPLAQVMDHLKNNGRYGYRRDTDTWELK